MTANDTNPTATPVHDASALLTELGKSIATEFARNRRVLSFSEYVSLATQQPTRQLRSAAQYMVACFDHFGSSDVTYPWGKIRRFAMFDTPWVESIVGERDRISNDDRLYGQEEVQNQVYSSLQSFVADGRPNKLILLHGPNGSAKSTFVRALGRGLEHYSTLDDGAMYRFSWIFPTQKSSKGGLGFGGAVAPTAAGESFAFLQDEAVDARLGDELRDHPLLLIPVAQRSAMLDQMLAAHPGFHVSDYLRHGSLSPKNRAIFEALLASYHGDFLNVLRHVRVERFYISARYRQGWVTVEPQLSVDATERQVTADRSLSALPASLQSVSLFEYGGEIVGANRGMIEFDDLLKRPLEHYKYLLTSIERAALSMQSATLLLDLVFIGSCNDIHLSAFREIPDFQSFKGRMEFVRVPYLRDVGHEQSLYQARLAEAAGPKHIAPHTAHVAALWALLTRMRKPQADRYTGGLAETVASMTPLDKAMLYHRGTVPRGLTHERARELLPAIATLWHESDSYPMYEGRVGASPREMQSILQSAATSTRYAYVSPLVVLDEITELCKQINVYEFLRQEALSGGYHDHPRLVATVRDQLFDRIDEDVRRAVGLVDEGEYTRVFELYVTHVMHTIRKEKVRNASTGRLEEPDAALLLEVETTLGVASAMSAEFRSGLIAKIGAWSIDHKGEKPDVTKIFSDLLSKLRDAYFLRHKDQIRKGVGELVRELAGDTSSLDEAGKQRARTARERLLATGYTQESARDLVGALAGLRYRG
jgi:serine protein kinase